MSSRHVADVALMQNDELRVAQTYVDIRVTGTYETRNTEPAAVAAVAMSVAAAAAAAVRWLTCRSICSTSCADAVSAV